MSMQLPVNEEDVEQLLAWAEQHADDGTTDHETGTYEQGVTDTLNWMLGRNSSRPDED